MPSSFRSHTAIRRLLFSILISSLSLTLTACGGDHGSASNASEEHVADISGSARQVSQPASVTPAVASRKSADESSIVSSSMGAPDGVRSDVHAFVAALTVSDAQRSALYRAARAMQAVLSINLGHRPELQTAVNDLAQAKACLRAQRVGDGETVWNALSVRTYDTLLRRLRQVAFVIASRLLTQPPTDVSCAAMPSPATGGATGGGTAPPPPPPTPPAPPSVARQLGAEIVRLEQQGVLPALDRSTDVRGPDLNNNGIRDDIDVYIARLSLTDAQKKAAMQRARSQQSKLLVDLSDKNAVQNLSIQSMAATNCMGDVFDGKDTHQADELAHRISAITANTPERAQRYIRFMAALSGTSVEYPSGNTCEE